MFHGCFMLRRAPFSSLLPLALVSVLVLPGQFGCGTAASGSGSQPPCTGTEDCLQGVCVSGVCESTDDGGNAGDVVAVDAGADTGADADEDSTSTPDGGSVVPADPFQCTPCVSDEGCSLTTSCVQFQGDSLCLAPCSEAQCPTGYECAAVAGAGQRCVPDSGFCGTCVDGDSDGFVVGDLCGTQDCDDTQSQIFPGAAEVCNTVDDDCDGRIDEDTNRLTDPNNCGTCGNVCDAETTTGECMAGRCRATSCAEGFIDCDGDLSNGCERDEDDVNVCGGCDDLAGATPGAACGTCDSGEWACETDGSIVCAGDEGRAAQNVCRGCTELEGRPGLPCGTCLEGRLQCDGTDALTCLEPENIDEFETCGDVCCAPGSDCAYGLCVSDAECLTGDDCQNDQWCDPVTRRCIEYGGEPVGDFDEACTRLGTVARFAPRQQCRWSGPPAGDEYPAWTHVLSTPMVADFNFDGARGVIRPSIVFTSDDGVDGSSEAPTGLIRIIDGETCTQQFSLTMQLTSHSSPPAIGDLDNDGTPEIVAFRAGGGLVAYRYDRTAGTWGVLWQARYSDGALLAATGGAWGGPAIHDLNDDGIPEILRGGIVVGADGIVLNDSLGGLAVAQSAPAHSAVFDIDGDGAVELVTGDAAWQWNSTANRWDTEAWFAPAAPLSRGYLAVGDFGEFPSTVLDAATSPEMVVVVPGGGLRVQTAEGRVIFGGIAIPGGGTGGPPTIGDFDGDGRAEFAAASRGAYTVFDFDCLPAGRIGTCASGRTDGILWSRVSQDFSSSQTGSSIFDFEGDERAEAIYADECFTRVYDGESGDVIFSAYRSSCTWQESPIVADVDGDFNSELVVPSNTNCSVACSGLDPGNLDPQFPGIRCEENADCVSGSCDAGLCRCTADTECCLGSCSDFGFVCAAPPAGTAGSGNTCRSRHSPGLSGILVYSDALDRWVNSRPIWNQLAYFVTNVRDDGRIPRTSEAQRHWTIPGLNSFRQNIQGDLQFNAAPDLTVRRASGGFVCDGDGSAPLLAQVCNRGTEAVPAGADILFARETEGGRVPVCREPLSTNLESGECVPISCRITGLTTSPPGETISILVDPDSVNQECVEGNNSATITGVYCGGI